MERLLLLWDEVDEYLGWGRHIAAGFADSMSRRRQAIARRLRALAPASSQL
ncbi:MAG: hypothetical protein ABW278_15300 [Steroidobacteraceae bacterium]